MEMTAEDVRKIFELEESTGILRWRFNPERAKCWNTRHAGKPVGSPSHGYLQVRVGRLYQVHRLVWLYIHGEWPVDFLDHINGDKADNRLVNLRIATPSQNLCNRPMQKNNSCGFKGVRFRPHHKKWEGRINKDGRTVWRRYFDSAQEAAAARRLALSEFHNEFAKPQ